jgi:CrcB protein
VIKNLFFVAVGGGLGAVLRYLLSLFSQNGKSTFPYATFTTNVLGCLCLGILAGFLLKSDNISNNPLFLLLGIGLLGGFTTFSSFSLDSIKLIQGGNTIQFFVYVIGTNVIGITLGYLGLKFASNI